MQVSRIPNIVFPPGPNGALRRKEVLAMGRLSHEKGFDLLLAAWSIAVELLPEWSLRIVGDGQLREQLVRQASTLGIERRVIFAPFSGDPYSLYSECGIFVCPNGPREVRRPGVNGLLVPAERVDALASAIVKLGENPMLRQRLGNAARSVSKPFSEPRVVARWHEVLYSQTPIARKPVVSVVPDRAVSQREAGRPTA